MNAGFPLRLTLVPNKLHRREESSRWLPAPLLQQKALGMLPVKSWSIGVICGVLAGSQKYDPGQVFRKFNVEALRCWQRPLLQHIGVNLVFVAESAIQPAREKTSQSAPDISVSENDATSL